MGGSLKNKVDEEQLSQLNIQGHFLELWNRAYKAKEASISANRAGNLPSCTVSSRPFCQKVFVILPSAQEADTSPTVGRPLQGPPWFVARLCWLPPLTRVILSPRPHLAEKVLFHQRGREGWQEEQKTTACQCSSPPPFPGDSLRMAGHHHPGCWLDQVNFEVHSGWYSDKGRTGRHPLRVISSHKKKESILDSPT